MRRSITLLLTAVLTFAAGDGFPPAFGPVAPGAQTQVPRVVPGFFDPAQRAGSAFRNVDPHYRRASYWTRLHSLVTGATWLVSERRVAALPRATPDLPALRENREATATWIGHSTVLVQLDGVTFVTDPNWADRSGPFSGFVGVSRYTPPGVAFDDLPKVDFVLISHDHYDHLDEPTVRRLAERFDPLFIVPLGIKAWLADRGITNAVELNWGESAQVEGLTVVCTPAQHGGGRSVIDQGRRLWSSWAVLGSKRFYFGGDTGYYRHFKETGDRLGPFDLAALPIGSYTPREIAKPVHISPEEAVQAALDLRAAHLLGVHWGTFALAREPYDQPPARLRAEIERRQLDPARAWILDPGQTVRW
ncbi:MAG TPA: MBL fold metallo-hydrolase [Methylomirabilota bacterium]|nr:MBL fold metallo-hydrolase [Methylomirabilota bacterium]